MSNFFQDDPLLDADNKALKPADETSSVSGFFTDDLSFGEPEQEIPTEDGRNWYVVHCYSGYENKVRHNLEQRIETMGMKDKIFDVVVPTEEEIEELHKILQV